MTLMEFLLRLRYLAVVAVLFCILNSIAFLALGVYESFHAYPVIVTGMSWNEAKSAGVSIVESIDTFLVALVLIILALGLTELFLVSDERRDALPIPPWMKVKSFLDLKLLLWEAVLTVLVVVFLGLATKTEDLRWEVLILPASILMLAISLFIMKKISGGHD